MGAMCWHEATAEAAKGRERDTVLGFSDLLKEAVGFFFSFFFFKSNSWGFAGSPVVKEAVSQGPWVQPLVG